MYKLNPKEYKRIFAVPSSVVEKYITTAGSLSLKLLLLILYNSDRTLDVQELADTLNVSVPDVRDAANFWIVNGILENAQENRTEKTAEKALNKAVQSETDTIQIKRISQSPVRLTGKELAARIKESADIRFLIGETEKYFGKNLIPSEVSVLISLYDWAGLPADIILMIVSYCASLNKNNMRTVEKLALDWIDKGIDSHEEVAAHIRQLSAKNSNEAAVKSAFGIFNRSLTTKEKNYIESWFTNLGFGIDMIKLAYEKNVDSTGSMSFPYINKILVSWNEKGIKTASEAEEEQKAAKARVKSSTGPSYNLEEFERLTKDKII